jgi:hypothetical protein
VTDPLATPAAPQAIEAVVDSNLGNYRIKYYQAVTRETLPVTRDAGAGGAPVRETDEPFAVLEHGPVDELPAEIKKPTIYVVFSQPVVPLAKLGQVARSSEILKIQPPLEGVYRWYGTKMLAFESDTDALPQKLYTVTVDQGVRSLGGKSLTGSASFTFHTEPLALAGLVVGNPKDFVNQEDAPPAAAQTLTVRFNSAVDPSQVLPSLKLKAGTKEWALNGPSGSSPVKEIVVRPRDPLPENTAFRVVLEAGARGEAGGLRTEAAQELAFHTLKPFQFVEGTTSSYSFPASLQGDANPVYLEFTHPLDKAGLAAKLSVSPSLPIKDSDLELWGTSLKINNLPVKYDASYTFRLDGTVKDVYGRSLGSPATFTLKVGDPYRYAYFPNEGARMLEAQFPPRIVWEEQDVTKGTWKIGALEDPYSFWPKESLTPLDLSKVKPHTKHFEVVDLKPYLNADGKGTVSLAWNLYQNMRWDPNKPEFTALTVQVTDLGLTLRYGYNRVVALVTSLSTGKPVAGAAVSLLAYREVVKSQTTGADGVVDLALTEAEARRLLADERWYQSNGSFRVKVVAGTDQLEFAPNNSHNLWHNGVWSYGSPLELMNRESQQTFLFSDRKIYRPGETLTFRGIDRTLRQGRYESYVGGYDLALVSPFGDSPVVAKTTGTTTESGGFHGTFALSAELAPGDYWLEYDRGGKTKVREPITINFFRRLLFSAQLSKADHPWFAGDDLTGRLSAEYLSGGSLGGARYEGFWNKEPAWFRPEGTRWSGWSFGPGSSDQRYSLAGFQGALAAGGSADLKQATTAEGVLGLPYTYNVGVNVTDPASNQLVSASDSYLVHPALFYLGSRIKNASGTYTDFVEQNQTLSLETALVRPDGSDFTSSSPVVTVEVHSEDWKQVQQQGVGGVVETRWDKVDTVVQKQTTKAASAAVRTEFKPADGGSYYVLVKADDPAGRTAVTKRRFYVTGSEWIRWYRGDEADLGLQPDQAVYKPGDTAKLLLQSPLPEGTYLVTVEREGLLDKKLVTVKGSTATLEIPIREDYLPIVYVAVSSYSVRQGPPTSSYYQPDLGKPKGYFGIVPLTVESAAKKIDLVLTTDQKAYRPGTDAEVTVQAFNRGKPLADAEITFMAVDRGVVDLVNYHVPDPVKFFYDPDKFPLGVRGADSRSLLIDPVTYQVKDQPGGDASDTKINERKDFRPTAVFEPYLKTDSQGRVKVKFKLPDSLTTYRTTAVAVKGDLFGLSEGDVRVQNPINMRAALPRKLRERDTAYAGVVITNLDTKAQTVKVTAASDLLTIDKETAKSLTLESGQSGEIAFLLAAERPGVGEISFTLASDLVNETLRQPFEVERPTVFESVATLGKVTDGDTAKGADGTLSGPFREEGVILPSTATDGRGDLTVTLDATRVGNLSQAFDYTFLYPYGCLEQRSSRVLPLIVFGDYIKAFGIASQVVDPRATVQNELAYILKNQNPDGGFPVWPGGNTNYYVSIRVAHILKYAQDGGYTLPAGFRLGGLLDFLASHLDDVKAYWSYGDWVKLYSLYVQALHGRSLSGRLAVFADKGDKLGLLGYGMLGLAYENTGQRDKAAQVLQRMKNFLRPSTRSVDLTDTEESAWTAFENGSGVSKLSVLLLLLQKLEPGSDMVQRVVTSLTDRQKAGVWHNTDDTTWALQALAQVIKSEESGQPDFQAKVSLDGKPLMTEAFQGIAASRRSAVLALAGEALKGVARDAVKPLRFEKTGPGTLFYTAQLKYAIPVETAVPRDEGLGLFTEVTDLEGAPLADGKTLQTGKIYRMTATLTTSKDRSWVAARLPIPSGAEILDAKLSTGALVAKKPQAEDENSDEGWYPRSEHQEIYDNEVRFFFDNLDKGTRRFEFLFRAVNQGVYPVPPPTVECMYEPEVFGRDLGRLFVVTRKP